jgi:hypothetical protein
VAAFRIGRIGWNVGLGMPEVNIIGMIGPTRLLLSSPAINGAGYRAPAAAPLGTARSIAAMSGALSATPTAPSASAREAACADERDDLVPLRRHPGNGRLSDADALCFGDCSQRLDQSEVGIDIAALEARAQRAIIAGRRHILAPERGLCGISNNG